MTCRHSGHPRVASAVHTPLHILRPTSRRAYDNGHRGSNLLRAASTRHDWRIPDNQAHSFQLHLRSSQSTQPGRGRPLRSAPPSTVGFPDAPSDKRLLSRRRGSGIVREAWRLACGPCSDVDLITAMINRLPSQPVCSLVPSSLVGVYTASLYPPVGGVGCHPSGVQ